MVIITKMWVERYSKAATCIVAIMPPIMTAFGKLIFHNFIQPLFFPLLRYVQ